MKEVRIGLIGTGGMGKAHATAFNNVPLVFGNEPARPNSGNRRGCGRGSRGKAWADELWLCPLDDELARNR